MKIVLIGKLVPLTHGTIRMHVTYTIMLFFPLHYYRMVATSQFITSNPLSLKFNITFHHIQIGMVT
jgi:hypothetical protein